MRAKAFTDVIVGGHDGGALGASLSLLGASCRGTMPSAAWGSQGEDPVHLWTCGVGVLASYPLGGVVFGVPSRLMVVVVAG
jgi:hypothetical protein